MGLRDGLITVAWGDGLVSEVGPQEILVASTDDDLDDVDDDSFYASDEDGDAESWETLSADGSEQEAAPQEDPASEVRFWVLALFCLQLFALPGFRLAARLWSMPLLRIYPRSDSFSSLPPGLCYFRIMLSDHQV